MAYASPRNVIFKHHSYKTHKNILCNFKRSLKVKIKSSQKSIKVSYTFFDGFTPLYKTLPYIPISCDVDLEKVDFYRLASVAPLPRWAIRYWGGLRQPSMYNILVVHTRLNENKYHPFLSFVILFWLSLNELSTPI